MRGHIRKKPSGAWEIAFNAGHEVNPKTGKLRRKQKFMTVQGTKKQAEATLAELLGDVNKGTFVEPKRVTVGEWLALWFENHRESVKIRTPETST